MIINKTKLAEEITLELIATRDFLPVAKNIGSEAKPFFINGYGTACEEGEEIDEEKAGIALRKLVYRFITITLHTINWRDFMKSKATLKEGLKLIVTFYRHRRNMSLYFLSILNQLLSYEFTDVEMIRRTVEKHVSEASNFEVENAELLTQWLIKVITDFWGERPAHRPK